MSTIIYNTVLYLKTEKQCDANREKHCMTKFANP